jgi:predicted transcriptional regulator
LVAHIGHPLHAVLTILLNHGYSQLPVVDTRQQPISMITIDSVMRALKNLRVSGAELQVADGMTKKPPMCGSSRSTRARQIAIIEIETARTD